MHNLVGGSSGLWAGPWHVGERPVELLCEPLLVHGVVVEHAAHGAPDGAKLRTEVVRADYLGIEPVLEMTFAAFAEEWLDWARHAHAESSYVGEQNKVRNQLIPGRGVGRARGLHRLG